MISKHDIEFIRSLAQKKKREEYGVFVAEGEKIVFDLLKTDLILSQLYYTSEAATLLGNLPESQRFVQISHREMERISAFKTSSHVLALFELPPYKEAATPTFAGLNLVLDGVQDPGNLGTIIRLADWFGI